MKKIICLLLALFMTAALVSCGKPVDPEGTVEPADTAPTYSNFDIFFKSSMVIGEQQRITYSITVLDGGGTLPEEYKNTFSSSDEKVLTVDDEGIATAHSAGTATVTIGNKFFRKSVNITVTGEPVAYICEIEIEYKDMMAVGSEQKLGVNVLRPDDLPASELLFASSNEKILTVDKSGVVSAVAPGSATITVSEGAAEKSVVITVYEDIPPIPFSKHAETPKAIITIDGEKYEAYHEMASCREGSLEGDGYDVMTHNYLPSIDKIPFVKFCFDSNIDIMAGGCLPLGSVIVYDAETGKCLYDDSEKKSEIDVGSLGGLVPGRYVLKFRVTDSGNGAFAGDYITEVFFVGIEIEEEPQIQPYDPPLAYKPVIYLYPTEQTDVIITYVNSENLKTTYPKYNGAWRVHADVDGTLTDENGRTYYAIFFDEARTYTVDFSEGFYVTAENAIYFLEEKLALLGLSEREADEFIMFWLPVLQQNGQSVVYFEQTTERAAECPVDVVPAPDCTLRVIIHIKQVNAPVDIAEQTLTPTERGGFTLVEWGGTTY